MKRWFTLRIVPAIVLALSFVSCSTLGVTRVAYSPEGERIVSGSGDGLIRLWDAEGRQTASFTAHEEAVNVLSFSADGNFIFSGSEEAMKIWDARGGNLVESIQPDSDINTGVFVPDGSLIYAITNGKYIEGWDMKNKKDLGRMNAGSLIWVLAIKPDGSQLAAGAPSIWRWKIGKTLSRLPKMEGHSGMISCLAYSPDGTLLASGSFDKTAKIWDAGTGKALKTLRGHNGAVNCVAFSSDGSRLVSASKDKTLKVWDIESGRELLSLRGHTDTIFSAAFSPDGRRIVSGSNDKTLRIWDAETGQELKTAVAGQ